MSDENPNIKRVNDLVTDFVKSRLSHPFLGTFIISTILVNYEVLLILFFDLKEYPVEVALDCFKDSEINLIKPALIATSVPLLLEPILNTIHQKILAIFRRIARNWVETEERKTLSLENEKLISQLKKANYDYKQQREIYESILRIIVPRIENESVITFQEEGNPKHPYLIFKSDEALVRGNLVCLSNNKIHSFNNNFPFLGKVHSVLPYHFYIVKVDLTLEEEIKEYINVNKFDNQKLYYDPIKSELTWKNANDESLVFLEINPNQRLVPIRCKTIETEVITEYYKNLDLYLDHMKYEKYRKRFSILEKIKIVFGIY